MICRRLSRRAPAVDQQSADQLAGLPGDTGVTRRNCDAGRRRQEVGPTGVMLVGLAAVMANSVADVGGARRAPEDVAAEVAQLEGGPGLAGAVRA